MKDRKLVTIVYVLPGDSMRWCVRVLKKDVPAKVAELEGKGWLICYVDEER